MTETRFDELKKTEAGLVNNLHLVLQNPEKEDELSDTIFAEHQNWLKLIMPNYSTKIHQELIKKYDTDPQYQYYYDEKAGKGATKILVRIAKKYLGK
ncbi:TipAS antibiotic-recognition domain-containing protein [Lactobacillus sp. ESL0791]|uniref:TipAS antibiotic-recognition domain-containing protein n=1 Tax=Lactobacillus sp. ESL0791 TaxID=2983234 RepID=UPI0023F79BD9|nr:TipAS antibiotic-recognition domain-containing protein [Lactobacillus sp. ESL0791]MDF7639036.1 TipAS antibiotic-recognition domain-containing protein [Lactobacillus sp. ESL0791]